MESDAGNNCLQRVGRDAAVKQIDKSFLALTKVFESDRLATQAELQGVRISPESKSGWVYFDYHRQILTRGHIGMSE
jgi:hypothetical protein